ncbi:MAG: aminopeptidase P family protein [Nitrososphaerota archaeon]|nr:aminopeptidase P family protein [Nitrososphaerota archaeon]
MISFVLNSYAGPVRSVHAKKYFKITQRLSQNVVKSLLNSDRAKMLMERYNLDALLSSSRINTTYLTDFDCISHVYDRQYNVVPGSGDDYVQTYGIFTKSGRKCLILPESMYFVSELENNPTESKYTYGKPLSFRSGNPKFDSELESKYESRIRSGTNNFDSAPDALCAAVKNLVGTSGTMALDSNEMSQSAKNKLASSFPNMKLKRASELFRFIRMVKSEEEVRRLETASRITEKSLEAIINAIKPGVREVDVRKIFVESVIAQGGTFQSVHFMIPHGSKAGTMTTPTNDTFRNNTSGWLDFGCVYMGYFSDIGESFTLGRPEEKVAKIYEALKMVIERCEEFIRPGIKCSEINSEAAKTWERAGVERPPTGMGHGLGLEVHEYPRISAAKGETLRNSSGIKDDIVESSIDIQIEEGMVLAIEAPYMQWGWGGVHVEREILVEKNGTRRLSEEPRFLRQIG